MIVSRGSFVLFDDLLDATFKVRPCRMFENFIQLGAVLRAVERIGIRQPDFGYFSRMRPGFFKGLPPFFAPPMIRIRRQVRTSRFAWSKLNIESKQVVLQRLISI